MARSRKRKRRKQKPRPQQQPTVTRATRPVRAKILKWVAGGFSFLVLASGLLPLFQIPSVDSPTPMDSSDPYSLPLVIKNNSLLPIWKIHYSCAPSFQFVEGGSMGGFQITKPQFYKALLLPGQEMSARCEQTQSVIDGRFKSAELDLFFPYHYALWPFAWTHFYVFTAAISRGQIKRWLPE